MRPLRRLQHPLSILLISALLISHVAAQALPKLPGNNENNDDKAAATTEAAKTTKEDAAKTTKEDAAKTTAKASASASATDPAALSGLPKLGQDDYPKPTVPPTADAPFMQKSNLPDGTVFIAVGAALGFFGFLVLAWRGLVAWSLHRSVKRAAITQSAKYSQVGDPRTASGKRKGPYFDPGPGSTMSLDQLGGMNKGGSKTHSAHGSLFFSPTAGAGMQSSANRGSGYLPAGYYASGNAAPGGGSGMTHVGGGGGGLANLRPESHRYSRARSIGPSPPGSPGLPPSHGRESTYGRRLSAGDLTTHASNSSLNLSAPPGQSRAPSAYLEDLFENHPPGTLPPEEHGRSRR
ncbi:hypothetical protein MMC21_004680 [Puttea exsequens]|nr:hypothetical protein [Puttea exsequens]